VRLYSDKSTFGLRATTVDDVISCIRVCHARDFPLAPPVRPPNTRAERKREKERESVCV
jgi:hypothetical protein